MDLDVSVKCCEMLKTKFDGLLYELGNKMDEPMDFTSIVKHVFKSTLNLLLTACNW